MRVIGVAAGAIVVLAMGALIRDKWQSPSGGPASSNSAGEPQEAEVVVRRDGAGRAAQRLAHLQGQRLSAMDDEMTAMKERLKSIESAQGAEDVDAEEAGDDSEPARSRRVTDGAVVDWMKNQLIQEPSSSSRVVEVEGQIKAMLPAVPGVRLEQTQCGERFCRATFSRDDGEEPDVLPLLGEGPPFVNESMTKVEDDGRVAIYFTAKNVSVDALRSEVKQAALE